MAKKISKYTSSAPQIVGFVCNWSAYSGVEMAGVEKIEYPANIKLVRLPCLGRLHLGHILNSFELGAGGVVLLGCPPDDCHYESGTEKAKEVLAQAKEIINLLGIDPLRLGFIEVPIGRGDIVASQLTAFVKQIEVLESHPKQKGHAPVLSGGKK
ncbi:MAG: hydrogenase iron-sulfur subunit [Dehalococcoidales bacterium]|nr:hydrogenase iron-sulfur subunit [Dehalococcoidales bacterium]